MNKNKSLKIGKRCACCAVELVRVSADIIKINNDDETSIIMRSHAGSTIFENKHTHPPRHMKVVHLLIIK